MTKAERLAKFDRVIAEKREEIERITRNAKFATTKADKEFWLINLEWAQADLDELGNNRMNAAMAD